MAKTYFVTGTDTDAGKTFVSCALLHRARMDGFETLALKPIASGCEATDDGLRNDDALKLQSAMTVDLDYEQVNPVAFEPAIAPHIAAARAGKNMQISRLAGYCRGAMFNKSDLCLIEGAGGWRVPVNDREFLSGLPKELGVGVIVVVAMKLGCINHALLTFDAIESDGLRVAGWVANRIDENMACYEENLATLKRHVNAPLLGEVPFVSTGNSSDAAEFLTITALGF